MKKKSLEKSVLTELFQIRNPHLRPTLNNLNQLYSVILEEVNKSHIFVKIGEIKLSKKSYFELTTSRNRNLINIAQQNVLRRSRIAFFGLSIGGHCAITWARLSRCDDIAISDPDLLSMTNLNRMVGSHDNVGMLKINLITQELIKINPFLTINKQKKIDLKNQNIVNEYFKNIHCIVDEIDNFEDKVRLRRIAKKFHIPLISAADVGDNIVCDIERYDKNEDTPIFLGRVPELENISLENLTDDEKMRYIIRLVGFQSNSTEMIDSLIGIKANVVTWPQLGSTATMAGGLVAAVLKKILLGESIESGRYILSLDDLFTPKRKEDVVLKKKKINKIKDLINSK